MKWKPGDRVYFPGMAPSDKPKTDGGPSMKWVTVFGGTIVDLNAVKIDKIMVPAATVHVPRAPDGMKSTPEGGTRTQVACSELHRDLQDALVAAGRQYDTYRERMCSDMEYYQERLDSNAQHLAGLNPAAIWGLQAR